MKHITILLILSVVQVLAFTWYIHPDSALNSIQAGLDSCAANDSVLVGPGFYYENIWWPSVHGICLTSEAGPETTIIDGQYIGRVIFIPDIGSDPKGIINGFKIQHGRIDWKGGGIYCCADSFQISENIITNNEAYGSGGEGGGISGIMLKSLFIRHNVITGNVAPDGGGINCVGGAIIVDNLICGNDAGVGGGVYCPGNTRALVIRNNTIAHNAAWYGGGLWLDNAYDILMVANVVDSNELTNLVTGEGAGICLWNDGTALIDSNYLTNNIGSGVCCNHGAHPRITCNTIAGNTGYGVENKHNSLIVNAEYNWWGDSTGPYHPDSNPGGLGDSVSDYVDFIPWLDWPGVEEKSAAEPVVRHKTFGATVYAGPLRLPAGHSCRVFDITGRMVMPQHMRSGVYFIEIDNKNIQKILKVR
jgi:hypothetical protein